MGNATTTLRLHNTTDHAAEVRGEVDDRHSDPRSLRLEPNERGEMRLSREGPGKVHGRITVRFPEKHTVIAFSLGIEMNPVTDEVLLRDTDVLVNGKPRGRVVLEAQLCMSAHASLQSSRMSSSSPDMSLMDEAAAINHGLETFEGEALLDQTLAGSQLQHELHDLVQRFRPVLWLYSGDEYRPSSFEDYLSNCELWFKNRLILPRGQVNSQSLIEQETVDESGVLSRSKGEVGPDGRLTADGRWHLKCDPDCHYGAKPEEINDVPLYAHVTFDTVRDTEVYAITYITFHPYNGAYKVALDERGKTNTLQGGHEADVEHLRIHVDRRTLQLHSVQFSAHRERDGSFRYAKDVETEGPDTVVAYVAQNGHGHYPKAGTWRRIFFLANDVCDQGIKWEANTVVWLPEPWAEDVVRAAGLEWLLFTGCWGTNYADYKHCSRREQEGEIARPSGCPKGPATHDWWITEDCKSRHVFKRVFMPFAR